MYVPKVSVIVPIFNCEEYLSDCLDSLIHQTLKEIEIICVNDGSTDDSLKILESFASRDRRITYFSQSNQGLSAARNAGVRLAKGEYLYFIDADDYIDCDAFEYLYDQAHKDDLDILYFDGITFYESEELREKFSSVDYCFREKEYAGVMNGESLYIKMAADASFRPMVWLQFISRTFYESEKLEFKEGILHEDDLFTYTTVFKAKRVSHRRKNFYHYRRRKGSIISGPVTFHHAYSKLICLIEITRFIRLHSFEDETIHLMGAYLKWLYNAMKGNFSQLGLTSQQLNLKLSKTELKYYYVMQDYLEDFIITVDDDLVHPDDLIESLWNFYQRHYADKKRKETAIKDLQQQTVALQNQLQASKKAYEDVLKGKDANIRFLEQELHNVKTGYSFRTGRIITFIPRKCRGGIRCYKQHGLNYTWKRILWHLGIIKEMK